MTRTTIDRHAFPLHSTPLTETLRPQPSNRSRLHRDLLVYGEAIGVAGNTGTMALLFYEIHRGERATAGIWTSEERIKR